MKRKRELDRLDWRILDALQRNARVVRASRKVKDQDARRRTSRSVYLPH